MLTVGWHRLQCVSSHAHESRSLDVQLRIRPPLACGVSEVFRLAQFACEPEARAFAWSDVREKALGKMLLMRFLRELYASASALPHCAALRGATNRCKAKGDGN